MGIQKISIKPKIKSTIIRLYKKNYSIGKIASELKLSKYLIRDHLKKQNIYDPNNTKLILKISYFHM